MRTLTPANSKNVLLTDGFLGSRVHLNRELTLHQQYARMEETGRIDQVRLAAGENVTRRCHGHKFWDSDIAKWLEAVGYSLAAYPDTELERLADAVVDLLEKAQEDDGYLNTYYSTFEPDKKWTNLRDNHELYCAGHLMEAAVAYHEATGKRKLLDVMCRMADHIDSRFGREKGNVRGYPGHEEIELALIRLHCATGETRYRDLAAYFVNERGHSPCFFQTEAETRGEQVRSSDWRYWQAHKPVREQDEAWGHAVRAMYLYAGAVDVATLTDDTELFEACRRLWNNTTTRKMYITGGVGARHTGEAFGEDYELPNSTAYAETCAAIGLVFFAHRMMLAEPDGKYVDILERALYNGVLSGLSLDGHHYFYVNPLSYDGKAPFFRGESNRRQKWFGCACCPANISRLLASLGQYVYSTNNDGDIYLHLYTASEASFQTGGAKLTVTQETDYPWGEEVKLTVQSSDILRKTIWLRVPGWCADYEVSIDGQPLESSVHRGYLPLQRDWSGTTVVDLTWRMPVETVAADPRVEAVRGCAALQRGPVVYCVEQVDNDVPVSNLVVHHGTQWTVDYCPDLLGGCCSITGDAYAIESTHAKSLYASPACLDVQPARLQAIPYALWANRGNHAMTVWMAYDRAGG
ncbi:MAG: glycoside hydrolase family 127 protein [Candidatus Pacebacteria bacterium]|nr:glycoside hydrolase family 127 protein [Candidatus Paceibacterota bacterium]